MPNRLSESTSPYLLQHADNPVDWYPWGKEALNRAAKEGKPILLSIGYAACHWCHVMEKESFRDTDIAEKMNTHFICIKVDREERPDIDEVYMAATVALNDGQGGWPMTVFLTPDRLEPFFAGTYFPPSAVGGRMAFPELLDQLSTSWKTQKEHIREEAAKLADRLRSLHSSHEPAPLGRLQMDLAISLLEDNFDCHFGGFGKAPKFPPTGALHFLLSEKSSIAETMVKKTLDSLASGGIFDQIGGGFFRYSVDNEWLVPHFEKMLYDNALLLSCFARAYQRFKNPLHLEVAKATADFILREMRSEDGFFYSSMDADTNGVEGKYYTWRPEDLDGVLEGAEKEAFCRFFDISKNGNWEGSSIPRTPNLPSTVAKVMDLSEEALLDHLALAKPKVLKERQKRQAPTIDDKAIASWNSLMIEALACAGDMLDEPSYKEAAELAANGLWKVLRPKKGTLHHSIRGGKPAGPAHLSDYAYFANALLSLGEQDKAKELTDEMVQRFEDPDRGDFFSTPHDSHSLFFRFREGSDGATPNPNAMAARVLARLGDKERGEKALVAYGGQIRQYPNLFTWALWTAGSILQGKQRIGELIGGAATEEGTRRYFQRYPGGKFLGTTGLVTSSVGFGCYRIDDKSPQFQQALSKALLSGCNLIDTSTNYADGASEIAVGKVLKELTGRTGLCRDEVIIVSKIGYIQGQNLKRLQKTPPLELVKVAPDCWHCIHPDYIAREIEASRERLQLKTIDVMLIHNPEYFLEHSKLPMEERRALFYERMAEAFQALEKAREKGHIGYYGVSSNTFGVDASASGFCSLEKLIELGGPGFKVVQMPINLIEAGATVCQNNSGKTALEVVEEHHLAALANRPLNAIQEGELIRLADFHPTGAPLNMEHALHLLLELEKQWVEGLAKEVSTTENSPKPEDFFTYHGVLDKLNNNVPGGDYWVQIYHQHLAPKLLHLVDVLDRFFSGRKEWQQWRDAYLHAINGIFNELHRQGQEASFQKAETVRNRFVDLIPDSRKNESLSRLALWSVSSLPGVSCVLNGMRHANYVDDSLGIVSWDALENARDVFHLDLGS